MKTTALLFASLVFLASVASAREDPTPRTPSEEELWQAVERQPQAEIDRLAGPGGEFTKKLATIQQQISALEGDIQSKERELEELRATITRRRELVARISTANLFGTSGYIAFVVLIIHLLIYLYRAPEPLVSFKRGALAALVILILFALPAFGAESLDEALSDANLLLSATPAEKALYWVEHFEGSGKLPGEGRVRDGLLTPYRDLERGSAEHHFTRAALLFETGSREGAIDSLRKLPGARPQTQPPDLLYLRTIQFLARETAETLDEVSKLLIPRMTNSAALMELGVTLERAGNERLRELAVGRIGLGTQSVPELATLTDQAYNLDGPQTGHRLAEIARDRVRTSGDAILLARVLYSGRDATLANEVLSKGIDAARDLKAIDELVSFCLGIEDFPLARRAAETAIERFGKSAAAHSIPDPRLTYREEILPGENQISLAVLLGILNEKLDLPAGAKPAYEYAAKLELSRILDVAAFSPTGNLRSLFYIQRFWRKQGDEEHLRLLRPVYEQAQEQTLAPLLAHIRADGDQSINLPGLEIRELEERRDSLRGEIGEAMLLLTRADRSLFLWLVHLSAVAAVALAVLCGCGLWARSRAIKVGGGSVRYVFSFYLLEAIGWLLTLSVAGVWIGLPLIVLSRSILGYRGEYSVINSEKSIT